MKIKVLLLIVLLVGTTCLVVYGRRRAPTYEEQRQMQRQLYEQQREQERANQERLRARREQRIRQKQAKSGSPGSLARLEARITALEHALTTQVSYERIPGMPEVPPDLRAVINAETIRQSKEGKAAVHAIARDRIIKAVKFQAGEKLKK